MGEQSQKPPDVKEFRAALDAVLRRRDPAALRAFLVERGQWSPEAATDPERAMWMMIAASPALAHLRGEAETWLRTHGHAAEADTILGRSHAAGTRPQARTRFDAPHKPSTPRRGPHQPKRRPRQ